MRDEVIFDWIDGSKLAARNGMTGATGNIYCGFHEFPDIAFLLHLLRSGDPHRRDRPGHEPVPDIGASTVVGRAGAAPRRERGQAPLDADQEGRALAQAGPRPVRLASGTQEDIYFQTQFLRLKVRAGPKKAAIAVAAAILETAYHMLKDGTCYHDLGADHFARRNLAREAAKLVKRIQSLGFEVDIRAAARHRTAQVAFLDKPLTRTFGRSWQKRGLSRHRIILSSEL